MSDNYWAMGISAVVSAVSFFCIFSNLIKARLIEDTPTSKIRSASQGYVELNGLAKADEYPIIAPLTNTPCLWYDYKIEHYRRSGKNSSWTTVEQKTSSQYFVLDDNTGNCNIDPRKADIVTRWRDQWRGHSRTPSPRSTGSIFSGNYRYTEKRIHAEDFLYTLGLFQTIHAPSAEKQKKQKMGELLNAWKRDHDALIQRFDTDGDGQLDMSEWEKARQEASKQAHYHVVKEYDDTPVHIMTHSPHRRNPYLISNKDPKELSRRYRWIAAGFGLAFAISTAICSQQVYQFFL